MKSVITLTVNPALDLSAAAERIVPTEKVRCHSSRRDPGGGGVNVARVIRRLGGKVQAIFPAGGLAGEALIQLLGQEEVESRVVGIAGETREDVTIRDEQANCQYRFILPGPELSEPEWRACLSAVEQAGAGFACASGSLAPGVPGDFYARFAEIAHRAGQKVFLDTSGDALAEALKAPVTLIKPNLRELRGLTGADLGGEGAWIKACQEVLGHSKLEALALTLGAEGALLVTRQSAFRARSPSVQPASTVGAGDSFMGALVWAMAADMGLAAALRFAVAAGTAAVLSEGTGLCHAPDIHRLERQVTVSELELSPL